MASKFDIQMMRRCFDLARLGGKNTKTNPMVGAIITHQDKIIGEGFHKAYGGPHAEVNAINNVSNKDQHLLPKATLYVSLEPCCFVGKTGACTSKIIEHRIPQVKVSALDPNPKVNGQGVQILREAGVRVETGLAEEEGKRIIAKFKANNLYKRPYVILKMVESQDGFIGQEGKRVWISNRISSLLSHKWRSEVDGILVGTNTAQVDNPVLNNRKYPGSSPMRIVLDRHERIGKTHHLINDELPTLVFTQSTDYQYENDLKAKVILQENEFALERILQVIFERGIYSLIVEGGGQVLKSFYEAQLWDEFRIIRAQKKLLSGLKSPLFQLKYQKKEALEGDVLFTSFKEYQ